MRRGLAITIWAGALLGASCVEAELQQTDQVTTKSFPKYCAQNATADCRRRGWHVSLIDRPNGSLVCTAPGFDENDHCTTCDKYNVYVWQKGAGDPLCEIPKGYSTVPGKVYGPHDPDCGCQDNLLDCRRSWYGTTDWCIPDISVCGNGILNTLAGETCDDGNRVSGDGCDENCQVEEVCDNGVDDDGNGLVDCYDPACSERPECRLCSFVAAESCESKGWSVTLTVPGGLVCAPPGGDENDNCDPCDSINYYIWQDGVGDPLCPRVYNTVAGNVYGGHEPCACTNTLLHCGTWALEGCIPD